MVSYGIIFQSHASRSMTSLNPCCSGRWSRTWYEEQEVFAWKEVLILVVVDDGLVLMSAISVGKNGDVSLNPCCSGRWSRTIMSQITVGRDGDVLILVVVDDGLVHFNAVEATILDLEVLILVVVDDGLVLI